LILFDVIFAFDQNVWDLPSIVVIKIATNLNLIWLGFFMDAKIMWVKITRTFKKACLFYMTVPIKN